MLFDLFSPRIIPNNGLDKNNPNRDYSHVSPILGRHSEVERPEYNYVYNTDGLRSIEFSTKPNVVALGCSITLGQGMPENLRWTSLLEKELRQYGDYRIGNISYSGAAINKDISSFFAMVHQYQYTPEYLVCNFANFDRFYFIDGNNEYMRDHYANHKNKKTKVSAPFDYEEILPYEWVYYQNLDHIKMLEAFCETNKIKLIWSTWSTNLSLDQEQFLSDNFRHYVKDPTRELFPPDFEYNVTPNSVSDLDPHYKMKNWDSIRCHEKYQEQYPEIFEHGYDYHKIAGSWGPGAHWPHPGLHRHTHWSEFYHEELLKLGIGK